MSGAVEVQFDGLVGPSHNYAGLGPGNLASQGNRGLLSEPRAAVLQGLAKARAVAGLGVAQAVFPPQLRPDLGLLRSVGFSGDDAAVLRKAQREAPGLLAAAWSSSAMWTANAGTVSPSADTVDGRLHVSAANLSSALHRSIEVGLTTRMLRRVFEDEALFVVHDALPAALSDEGAANHTRLAAEHGEAGIEVFVYGAEGPRGSVVGGVEPRTFNARQVRSASEAVARRHGLDAGRVVLVQQSPAAIDGGVFHNDVISVGDRDLLLVHELAYVDQAATLDRIRRCYEGLGRGALRVVEVAAERVSIEDAVRSYLFNSQLLTAGDGRRVMVCPEQCQRVDRVGGLLEEWKRDGVVDEVLFFDLHQSMRNGGGPACLRLRVVMDAAQRAAIPAGLWLTEERYAALCDWAERFYPERLSAEELADPGLVRVCREAKEALVGVIGL
ncbi:MAG: N-succinylarginine dihydrolase [Phycisphaeraceae bacterium]